MATINQVKKQIEVSRKRLSDYARKVEMYASRLQSNLEKAKRLTGDDVTEENFRVSLRCPDMFKLLCSIASAKDYRDENKRDLQKEEARLNALMKQLEKMDADLKNKEASELFLRQALVESLESFRVDWFKKMTDYYERVYCHMVKEFPSAQAKLEKCKRIIEKLIRLDYSRKYLKALRNSLEDIQDKLKNIVFHEANIYPHDEYMSRRHEDMVCTWNRGIKILTEKCKSFGIDEKSIETKPGEVLPDGICVIIADREDREIYARVIWAAQDSVLVTPHTRYIVTQKINK